MTIQQIASELLQKRQSLAHRNVGLLAIIDLADRQDEVIKRLAIVPRVVVNIAAAPGHTGPSDA